jgi:hypothetical protein
MLLISTTEHPATVLAESAKVHLHCIEFVHSSLPIPLWIGFYARNSDSSASLPDVKNRPKKISSPALCIPIENSWYSPECQICLQ